MKTDQVVAAVEPSCESLGKSHAHREKVAYNNFC